MAGSSNGNIPVTQCQQTKLNVSKVRFIWTLNNFGFCNNYDHGTTGKMLESSIFSAGANKQYKFQLQLFPEGSSDLTRDREYVSLYLKTNTKATFNANFKFSVLDAKHNQTNAMESHHKFSWPTNQRAGFFQFIMRELLLNEVNGLLPEDKLTTICEVVVVEEITISSSQRCAAKFSVPECPFAEDLGAIFDKQLLCDVTLTADGTEIKAHKIVLTERSSVFAAMFEHEMVERNHNNVTITDVKPEVLREMLRFVYTGRATNLDGELLAAADKYALERLKMMCEEALWKNLTIETAAETLIVADLHSAAGLKALTMDFICRCREVQCTDGWTNMMLTYPRLIDELMRAVVTRRDQHIPPMIGPPHKRFKPAAD